MKKNTLFLYITVAILVTFIFVACKKQEVLKTKKGNDEIIKIYEEIAERHNDFLSRSFISLRNKLKSKSVASGSLVSRPSQNFTEEQMRGIVFEVSSEELVPLLGNQFSEAQILNELRNNLPQDLTMESYSTTYECVNENALGVALSFTFREALGDLDIILKQCNNYSDSTIIFASLDQLRNRYILF